MGWNTFKKHFNIGHIVQIRGGDLLIGSAHISALARISMDTGAIQEEAYGGDHRFLQEYYPDVLVASREEIKALLDAQDTFTQSITVYTYEGLRILTKYCEELGYPSVTHDGVLMYKNEFSRPTLIMRCGGRNRSVSIRLKPCETGLTRSLKSLVNL